VTGLGATDTNTNNKMSASEKKQTLQMTALGRPGTAEDIADASVFLATDQARWTTGERLAAGGGLRV
jgi:NAD(P)-dependent dehydrogenase (short-subunit alcohol dehydrogenase family)